MRILIFMAHLCPWSQRTAAALQSLAHEVHVFDFRENPDGGLVSPKVPGILVDYEAFVSQVSGIHLVDAPRIGKARYLFAAPLLRRLARKIRADVILTLYGGGYALMAYCSGFRPYCVYVVGSDVLKAGHLGRRINRRTFTRAALVFANGEYLARRAAAQAPDARVMPLLIGVDPKLFQQARPEAGTVQFVCTRGFQPLYNNDAIIRAVAKLPSTAGQIRVVFTSGGALLEKSRALADRLLQGEARGRVQFLGGVSYQRLLEELRRSHAILSLSRSDGTATSVLEGMATGLYPVLSDIPQNRALIRTGESVGTLVPLGDDESLAGALLDLLCHAPERAAAAQQNRHFIARVANAQVNGRIVAMELQAAADDTPRSH